MSLPPLTTLLCSSRAAGYVGGGRGGRGKPAGPDVSPSAGARTASLTCGHETCRNVCIFQTCTLCQTSKATAGAGGALTDTNTITAYALLPALGKQKASSTPLENKKNTACFQAPPALCKGKAGFKGRWHCRQQHHWQPPSRAPRIPVSGITCLGVTATSGGGETLVWPVQALSPSKACRKWEFLVFRLLVVDQ